ncbi:TIR domain-containing protein [Actinoplanes sp. NPDC020271]|uniref:TIR domain-containing protein n=1 Tax=Actinoplanes sp. NPDC020271 TaxID=3363896 RepID=UPI0037B7657A
MPFDGFISYSHAADGRLAPAVQRGLHRLAKPWHRRRALWIFRDQTGLAVTPKLWSSIRAAMDDSNHFVLLASPEAARSTWVNREIEHWLEAKSPDLILPVVTEGEWQWDAGTGDFTADSTAVPPALRGVFAEEPLFLDLRWARDDLHLSLQHVRFRDAIAQLAAPMHGMSKDDLEGEDVRQHRRARRLWTAATAMLVLLTLVTSLTGVLAVHNADRATTAATEARVQQEVASQQRVTAERATAESQRQQQNAQEQEDRASAAKIETARQKRLAAEQRALADEASAEAKRQQDAADDYRASAQFQKSNAERQEQLAQGAGEEAKQQRAEAERQKAEARRQETLADQATTRAQEQKALAAEYRKAAHQADEERKRQEQLAREAADEARRQREAAAAQQRVEISRRLLARARAMAADDPRKALMLGVTAQRLNPDAQTAEQLSHLVMSTHYAGTLSDVDNVVSLAGQAVATVDAGGTVSVWDATKPSAPTRLAKLPGDTTRTASPAGNPATSATPAGNPATSATPAGNATTSTAPAGDTAKAATPARDATGAPTPTDDATKAAATLLVASPDGRTVAVFGGGTGAALWNVADPAHPVRLPPLTDAAGIASVAFSPDGRTVATSNNDKDTVLWDISGAVPAARSTLPDAYPLKFSPDGRTAITSGPTVTVWNVADPAHPVAGAKLAPLFGTPITDARIEFDPTMPLAAVEAGGDYVALWDLTDPAQPSQGASKLAVTGKAHLSSMTFSPDGRTLAFADAAGTTVLWNVEGGDWPWLSTRLATLNSPGGPVRSMGFSPDGRTLITAGPRRTATLWSTRGPFAQDASAVLPGPFPGKVVGLAFGADSRSLLAAGRQGSAVSWDVTDPKSPVRGDAVPLYGSTVEGITLSPDGGTMAVVGADKTVTLFDLKRAATLATIKDGTSAVAAVTFGPDGHTLAVGRSDGKTTLWDLTDSHQPTRLADLALRAPISAIAFTPDGRTMAVSESNYVTTVDVSTRSVPVQLTSVQLKDYAYAANALAFSPDGRTLAAGTDNATTVLWDVADPSRPYQAGTLVGHTNQVLSVAFSPDGRTLATASLDDAMMLWDVADPASPVPYAVIKSPDLQSFNTAFSPDGHTLAAGGGYGVPTRNVTLWDARVPSALAADPARPACTISGRGLDAGEWQQYVPELPYQPTC